MRQLNAFAVVIGLSLGLTGPCFGQGIPNGTLKRSIEPEFEPEFRPAPLPIHALDRPSAPTQRVSLSDEDRELIQQLVELAKVGRWMNLLTVVSTEIIAMSLLVILYKIFKAEKRDRQEKKDR